MGERTVKRMTFKVTVDIPDEGCEQEVAEYIKEEVESGGGNRDPQDYLFRKKNTKVVHVSTKR
jgi:hypothetical protein